MTEGSQKIDYINFKLKDQFYGIELNQVADIMQPTKLTKAPLGLNEMFGFFLKGNRQVMAIDLALLLGLNALDIENKVIIVLVHKQEYYGLMVDEIVDIGEIMYNAKLLSANDIFKKIEAYCT